MPRALQVVPPLPNLHTALERFLARSRLAARTRESYAQDVAPLVAQHGDEPVTGLTHQTIVAFLAAQEHLPQPRAGPRALDPEQIEAALRTIRAARDRALFWLIYDGGLRCQEALSINLENIDWAERSIRIHGKGDRAREMFFSRRVSRYLDDYLNQRGQPTLGPLFSTTRKARSPRRADLTADGYARLSYRRVDTLWKKYTPAWDLHQLRHTAISAHGYSEVELKRFSGHLSLRSLKGYIAHNREAAKRKASAWERHEPSGR